MSDLVKDATEGARLGAAAGSLGGPLWTLVGMVGGATVAVALDELSPETQAEVLAKLNANVPGGGLVALPEPVIPPSERLE